MISRNLKIQLIFALITLLGIFEAHAFKCPLNSLPTYKTQEEFKENFSSSFFKIFYYYPLDDNKGKIPIGTGTLVCSDGLVITSAHIFKNDNLIEKFNSKKISIFLKSKDVQTNEHYSYYAESIYVAIEKEADIAVIKMASNPKTIFPQPIPLSFPTGIENKHYTVAYKIDDDELRVTEQDVGAKIGRDHVAIGAAFGGWSGALAMDKRGFGVAILSRNYSNYDGVLFQEAKDNKVVGYNSLYDGISFLSRLDLKQADNLIKDIEEGKEIKNSTFKNIILKQSLCAPKIFNSLGNSENINIGKIHVNYVGLFDFCNCLFDHFKIRELFKNLVRYLSESSNEEAKKKLALTGLNQGRKLTKSFQENSLADDFTKALFAFDTFDQLADKVEWNSNENISKVYREISDLIKLNRDNYPTIIESFNMNSPKMLAKALSYSERPEIWLDVGIAYYEQEEFGKAQVAAAQAVTLSNDKSITEFNAIKDYAYYLSKQLSKDGTPEIKEHWSKVVSEKETDAFVIEELLPNQKFVVEFNNIPSDYVVGGIGSGFNRNEGKVNIQKNKNDEYLVTFKRPKPVLMECAENIEVGKKYPVSSTLINKVEIEKPTQKQIETVIKALGSPF